MKTIIAGSRTITDYAKVCSIIEEAKIDGIVITEVVSGTAKGIDQLGERWAFFNNIPVKKFPADWDKYGRVAGIMRNQQMAEYAEALIAIWDGSSNGTRNMIQEARNRNLKVFVKVVTK